MKKISIVVILLIGSVVAFTNYVVAKEGTTNNNSSTIKNEAGISLDYNRKVMQSSGVKEGESCSGDYSRSDTVAACDIAYPSCPTGVATCDNCSGVYLCIYTDECAGQCWVFAPTSVGACKCGDTSPSGKAAVDLTSGE